MKSDVDGARAKKGQLRLFRETPEDICKRVGLNWWTALQLFKQGLLSYNPETIKDPDDAQATELEFLGALISGGCDDALLRNMLSSLEKPYQYRLGAMFYDWASGAWTMLSTKPDAEEAFCEWLTELKDECDLDRLKSLRDAVQESLDEVSDELLSLGEEELRREKAERKVADYHFVAAVDGCNGGWLVAVEIVGSDATPELQVCPTFRDVIELTKSCRLVLVDMPIGLPEGANSRKCDLAAREKLQPAGAPRVFLAPPRATLRAETPEQFQRMHHEILGHGAGLPLWGIVPRMREVDEVMTAQLQERIREYHPEVAWARYAGGVLASKHRARGVMERWRILAEECEYQLGAMVGRNASAEVAIDDVLVCLLGLLVARDHILQPSKQCALPDGDPEVDARGLRMEILY